MESSDCGPSPKRQQSRFSEAMQNLGEDSQNSDSYSCFSENNSAHGYNDNFERRDKIIESFQINEIGEALDDFNQFDGDRKEEVVVSAVSCAMGNGGPDVLRVYTLVATGSLIQLPVKRYWKSRPPPLGQQPGSFFL